jgi:hypothetical protein
MDLMRMTYALHIAAATVALLSGYVALLSTKGGTLHRRSGMVFVYTMLATVAVGATIAIVWNRAPALNVPAALLTGYLVISGVLAVRPLPERLRWIHLALLIVALGVTLFDLGRGVQALTIGGREGALLAFASFLFGTFGVLGVAGDVRVMRTGPRTGTARLARHLWRVSSALLIAAMSFVSRPKVFPKPIRIAPVLAAPVVLVLVVMLLWLWRLGVRRSTRGVARLRNARPVLERA